MSRTACLDSENGTEIDVREVIGKEHQFYCCNKNCDARMIIVSYGKESAHFRSKSVAEHKFAYCFRNDLHFEPDEYDEKKFKMEHFIDTILSQKEKNNTTKKSTLSIGTNSKRQIETLKTLYSAFLHKGINGAYNGYAVNDYLCSVDNYEVYKNGFNGFKIVELTYYHKVFNEYALICNYPCFRNGQSSLVKIVFDNQKEFWKVYNHFKKLPTNQFWKEPMIVACNWELSATNDFVAVGHIIKASQHAYISSR